MIEVLFMSFMIYFLWLFYRRGQSVCRMEEESHLQRQIIRQQKEAIQSIRKKQHEYKNNISNLNALLLERDVEKARHFMKELLNQNVYTDQMIRRHSSFVQILIDYKMQEAARKQIQISQDVFVCHDIPIDELDVAVIINNAMNNAIESCEKLPVSERYIKCILNMKMKYLNFYFENPCGDTVMRKNGKLVTTKRNKAEHGIGMQNMEDVVDRYHGFLNYYVEDNVFCLKCSLLIAEGKSA